MIPNQLCVSHACISQINLAISPRSYLTIKKHQFPQQFTTKIIYLTLLHIFSETFLNKSFMNKYQNSLQKSIKSNKMRHESILAANEGIRFHSVRILKKAEKENRSQLPEKFMSEPCRIMKKELSPPISPENPAISTSNRISTPKKTHLKSINTRNPSLKRVTLQDSPRPAPKRTKRPELPLTNGHRGTKRTRSPTDPPRTDLYTINPPPPRIDTHGTDAPPPKPRQIARMQCSSSTSYPNRKIGSSSINKATFPPPQLKRQITIGLPPPRIGTHGTNIPPPRPRQIATMQCSSSTSHPNRKTGPLPRKATFTQNTPTENSTQYRPERRARGMQATNASESPNYQLYLQRRRTEALEKRKFLREEEVYIPIQAIPRSMRRRSLQRSRSPVDYTELSQ